ncbi:hypothetical protein MIC97_22415 [Aquamicrobium sp. NLF2-7]|uniref:phage exclusion protein Lit family protein n=1 Tax=Aquamicrobium sp. NLF2-7 TaxID=2918753 RepID=UPI001EFBC52F|nr:phage exclusion protein Lit family protein [Aquamicrobium sp. NLF2-7]MCG8274240.1 hypothetical protein [Aquamicrobium sp. NLF2-7]
MTTTKEIAQPFFDLVAAAPFRIAPERADELTREIFRGDEWTLRPSETEANFYAIPEDKTIFASYAGLASLWCLAHAAFHTIDITSHRQRSSGAGEEQIDIGDYWKALRLGEYVAYARSLFRADTDWPDTLPQPSLDVGFDTPEGRVNNIFFGALSWIILHEIAHIHNADEVHVPHNQRVQQEYLADDFATRWVLKDAVSEMREFRVLMICLALTWLFLHEDTVRTGSTHPQAFLRFREAAAIFEMDDELSPGLENAAYLFKAVLDPSTEGPTFETPQEYFDWISERLEALFRE